MKTAIKGTNWFADGRYLQLVRHVQDRILTGYLDLYAATRTDRSRRVQLKSIINQILLADNLVHEKASREQLCDVLASELVGYGPIDPPIQDPDVTEIMINGPDLVFIERSGHIERCPIRFRDSAHIIDVVRRMVAPLGRRIDQSCPMVDARLADGSRINAIIPPVAVDGPVVTIRKFAPAVLSFKDLIELDAVSSIVADFLTDCVTARLNLIVSGGTGAGKTTMLNILSELISADRVITIEDAAELSLQTPHVVRLEYRPGNFEGRGEVTIRQLVKNALRMRPDRLLIGECRGAEAFDMLQAMNTGHEGSMTSVHANGSVDALRRLESMAVMAGESIPLRAIREQIISAVDGIVHLTRRSDNKRLVTSVSLVDKRPLTDSGLQLPPFVLGDVFRRMQGEATGFDGPLTLFDWCLDRFSQTGVRYDKWSSGSKLSA